tara:strand:- start:606 stop:851 length:246 start_codon:yes stop_codon:yes gene_type:complete
MGFDIEMEDYHEDKDMKKQLEKLMKEMTKEAKNVRGDYKKNPSPPEMSGSVHHVHENSPMLATKKDRLITFESKKNVDKKK